MADIVQNLRGFARLDHAVVDQANIHEALRTAVEMLRGRLDRRHITVEEHLGELPLVAGSAAQLNQVFLNLLVNAMQAIEATHREDGRIAITTLANNGEIVVEVADNGCGIPDEVLPQIFDPFFTTKDVGDGTGLGLSITHGMVQDHGGRLEVESVLGVGHALPRFPAGGPEPGRELILLEQARNRGYGERLVSSHETWQRGRL